MSAITTFPPAARLIAEIPGILGFHPANSVIFLLLHQADTNTLNLGPVLRMDVGDGESLPQITKCINSFGADIVFAVISSESTWWGRHPKQTHLHASQRVLPAEIDDLRGVAWQAPPLEAPS